MSSILTIDPNAPFVPIPVRHTTRNGQKRYTTPVPSLSGDDYDLQINTPAKKLMKDSIYYFQKKADNAYKYNTARDRMRAKLEAKRAEE
jgi:hypothetical protein